MDLFCKEIRKLEAKFYGVEYIHVVRDKNQAVDALSKLGSTRAQVPHGIFVQDLLKPSIEDALVGVSEIKQHEALLTTREAPLTMNNDDWCIPFIRYLMRYWSSR